MQKHPDWNMVSDFEMYVRYNFRIHIDIFGEFLVLGLYLMKNLRKVLIL